MSFNKSILSTTDSDSTQPPLGSHDDRNRHPPPHQQQRTQRSFEEIQMREDIHIIIREAIRSVDPVVAIQQSLTAVVVPLDTTTATVVTENSNPSSSTTTNATMIRIMNRQNSETILYQLDQYDNVIVIGIGKAASAMVSAALEIIDSVVETTETTTTTTTTTRCMKKPNVMGMVLTKYGHLTEKQRDFFKTHDILVREASHPIPCHAGVAASTEIMNLVSSSSLSSNGKNTTTSTSSNNKNLVLACISGGGSALFCTPKLSNNITLNDLQMTNTALLQTGWPISSMNMIRTVLEYGKGGGLAVAALQSSTASDVVSFILSDVVGDPMDIIASGPTVLRSDLKQQHTIQMAYELIQYRTPSHIQFPNAVKDFIRREYENLSSGSTTTTTINTNEDNAVSDNMQEQHCFNCIVGNNGVAVEAAALKAKTLGYHPIILTTQMQGEASAVAQILVSIAQNIQQPTTSFTLNPNTNQFPVALIVGGETTVTLPSDNATGVGGRNQELALAAALALQENHHPLRQIVVASVGTDGNDGPTDAAGAIIDGLTIQHLDAIATTASTTDDNIETPSSKLLGKNALQYHNAYPYLNQKDADNHSSLLKTGPTGTNVADIIIFLIHKPKKGVM